MAQFEQKVTNQHFGSVKGLGHEISSAMYKFVHFLAAFQKAFITAKNYIGARTIDQYESRVLAVNQYSKQGGTPNNLAGNSNKYNFSHMFHDLREGAKKTTAHLRLTFQVKKKNSIGSHFDPEVSILSKYLNFSHDPVPFKV
jgi:hypothetical protein